MSAFYDLYIAADKRRGEFAEAIGVARGTMRMALVELEEGDPHVAIRLLQRGIAESEALFVREPAESEEKSA